MGVTLSLRLPHHSQSKNPLNSNEALIEKFPQNTVNIRVLDRLLTLPKGFLSSVNRIVSSFRAGLSFSACIITEKRKTIQGTRQVSLS